MEVSTMIDIKIEKNSKELGSRPVKCESRLRELEQILRTQDSPMEFMCQSLGFPTSDKSSLDTYLLQTFQKNVPQNFHLLAGTSMKKHGFLSHKESSKYIYSFFCSLFLIKIYRKVGSTNPGSLHYLRRKDFASSLNG